MIKKDVRNVLVSWLGRWDSLRQLRILVSSDKYVLATMCGFGNWLHDIHCAKSSGPDAGKIRSLRQCRYLVLFLAQLVLVLTIWSSSATMWDQ